MTPTKVWLFAIFAFVVVVAFAGVIIIAIFRPDATATIISTSVTLLTLVSGFAVAAGLINAQNAKIETIQKQTNGNLSAVTDENTRLTNLLAAVGIDATSTKSVSIPTLQTGPVAVTPVVTEPVQAEPVTSTDTGYVSPHVNTVADTAIPLIDMAHAA